MLPKRTKFTIFKLLARKVIPSLRIGNAEVNLLREAITIFIEIYYSLLTCNTAIAKTD